MPVLGERFYQMSNVIFYYQLSPIQFSVYSYLVCCAGQKEKCWPSVKTISAHCNISENSVRKAITELEEREFIRKVKTKRCGQNGRWLQSNNQYFILELPKLPSAG